MAGTKKNIAVKDTHAQIDLLTIVEVLKKNNISMIEIAKKLKFFKSDKKTVNQSILTKLCTGALHTYKKKTVTDYLELLQKDSFYSSIIYRIIPEADPDDLSFIFYFFDESIIQLAVLYLYQDKDSKGNMFFLDERESGSFIEYKRLYIDSIYTKNPDTIDIYCKEKKASHINYFNCYKGAKKMEDIDYCYSTYYSTNSIPKFIVGVLQQIKSGQVNDYLKQIKDTNIPLEIIKLLYKKKFEIHSTNLSLSYNTIQKDLTASSYIAPLSGSWIGHFIEKNTHSIELTYGPIPFILFIQESGETHFYCKEVSSDQSVTFQHFRGFIELPLKNQINLVSIGLENDAQDSKMSFLLKFNSNALNGVLTSWKKVDSSFNTSPTVIKKFDSSNAPLNPSNVQIQHLFDTNLATSKKTKQLQESIKKELILVAETFFSNIY